MWRSFVCLRGRAFGGVTFERVKEEVAQKSEVFGGVTGAHATLILGEGHIERPVQLVLDAPPGADQVDGALSPTPVPTRYGSFYPSPPSEMCLKIPSGAITRL